MHEATLSGRMKNLLSYAAKVPKSVVLGATGLAIGLSPYFMARADDHVAVKADPAMEARVDPPLRGVGEIPCEECGDLVNDYSINDFPGIFPFGVSFNEDAGINGVFYITSIGSPEGSVIMFDPEIPEYMDIIDKGLGSIYGITSNSDSIWIFYLLEQTYKLARYDLDDLSEPVEIATVDYDSQTDVPSGLTLDSYGNLLMLNRSAGFGYISQWNSQTLSRMCSDKPTGIDDGWGLSVKPGSNEVFVTTLGGTTVDKGNVHYSGQTLQSFSYTGFCTLDDTINHYFPCGIAFVPEGTSDYSFAILNWPLVPDSNKILTFHDGSCQWSFQDLSSCMGGVDVQVYTDPEDLCATYDLQPVGGDGDVDLADLAVLQTLWPDQPYDP